MRHVARFSELTDQEIAAFGPLVRAASHALEAIIGCAKTYVVVLGEEVDHVHAHVIPRMRDFGDEVVGTAVFTRLSRPEDEWIPEGERDRLALALRPRIEQALD
jgi:diadenosine tetraphosphate (Ap4A) HIT family hydrolase